MSKRQKTGESNGTDQKENMNQEMVFINSGPLEITHPDIFLYHSSKQEYMLIQQKLQSPYTLTPTSVDWADPPLRLHVTQSGENIDWLRRSQDNSTHVQKSTLCRRFSLSWQYKIAPEYTVAADGLRFSPLEQQLCWAKQGPTFFCLVMSFIPMEVLRKAAVLNMRIRYIIAVQFRNSFQTGFSRLGVWGGDIENAGHQLQAELSEHHQNQSSVCLFHQMLLNISDKSERPMDNSKQSNPLLEILLDLTPNAFCVPQWVSEKERKLLFRMKMIKNINDDDPIERFKARLCCCAYRVSLKDILVCTPLLCLDMAPVRQMFSVINCLRDNYTDPSPLDFVEQVRTFAQNLMIDVVKGLKIVSQHGVGILSLTYQIYIYYTSGVDVQYIRFKEHAKGFLTMTDMYTVLSVGLTVVKLELQSFRASQRKHFYPVDEVLDFVEEWLDNSANCALHLAGSVVGKIQEKLVNQSKVIQTCQKIVKDPNKLFSVFQLSQTIIKERAQWFIDSVGQLQPKLDVQDPASRLIGSDRVDAVAGALASYEAPGPLDDRAQAIRTEDQRKVQNELISLSAVCRFIKMQKTMKWLRRRPEVHESQTIQNLDEDNDVQQNPSANLPFWLNKDDLFTAEEPYKFCPNFNQTQN